MALSYSQFEADGSVRDFAVKFQYIDKRHVSVLVDGFAVAFTWQSNFLVRTTAVPPKGKIVTVKRETPKDQVLVDYVDGSTLTETDLDLGTIQNFFLAQEAYDLAEGTLAVNADGSFSANNRRIGNVADPVSSHQVATKNYVDTASTSQVNQANSHRVAAAASAAAAKTSETIASTKATESSQSATASAAARDSASGHRLNAQTAATRSEDARDRSEAALAALSDEVTQAQTARAGSEAARDAAAQSATAAATWNPSSYYQKAEVYSRSETYHKDQLWTRNQTYSRTEADSRFGNKLDRGAKQLSATDNLNQFTDPGSWVQTANANASTARNYPNARAGLLEVERLTEGSAYEGTFIFQRYTDYNNVDVWTRTRYNGTWSGWRFQAMGDSYVQSRGSAWTPHPNSNRDSNWNYFFTDNGYIQFGPANAGFAHIYTDRPSFYFNKPIQVNGVELSTTVNVEDRAVAWANDRVARLATRLVSRGVAGSSGNFDIEAPAGAIVTGMSKSSGNTYQFYYRTLQLYDPVRGWVSASYA